MKKYMEQNPHLSVVSPVYKAEKIVAELVARLHESLVSITDSYEIILVNDASPDNSWAEIAAQCVKDNRVKGLDLSRNFGQHYAITAGLSFAKGAWVVVMDCDLQDRPDEIPNLYVKAQDGYDIVYAKRAKRRDGFFKQMSSKIFNATLAYLSGIKQDNVANFGIYSARVVAEYNKMKEYARAFGALVRYLGFPSCVIEVKHDARFEGKSSYTLTKLVNLAFDAIIATSNKPLKLAVKIGLLMAFGSFLLALYNVIAHFAGIIQVPGFTTTIFSIWFVGGTILSVLGILGTYIGKILIR